jgi:hypothetical protein
MMTRGQQQQWPMDGGESANKKKITSVSGRMSQSETQNKHKQTTSRCTHALEAPPQFMLSKRVQAIIRQEFCSCPNKMLKVFGEIQFSLCDIVRIHLIFLRNMEFLA